MKKSNLFVRNRVIVKRKNKNKISFKPIEPIKPLEPQKIIKNCIIIYENYYDNNSHFKDESIANIVKKYKGHEKIDYNNIYIYCSPYYGKVHFRVYTYEYIENKNYDEEYNKYLKDLDKYNKAKSKYYKDIEEYELNLKNDKMFKFFEDLKYCDEIKIKKLEQEINDLQNELKRLKENEK